MKILDFGKGGAVNPNTIQFMSGFEVSDSTSIGFIDGTEDDFAVSPQEAFKMWYDVKSPIIEVHGALIDFARVAAIQLFSKGHEDSPFGKKVSVIRVWFDHGELFLDANRRNVNPDAYLRKLINIWKAQ